MIELFCYHFISSSFLLYVGIGGYEHFLNTFQHSNSIDNDDVCFVLDVAKSPQVKAVSAVPKPKMKPSKASYEPKLGTLQRTLKFANSKQNDFASPIPHN